MGVLEEAVYNLRKLARQPRRMGDEVRVMHSDLKQIMDYYESTKQPRPDIGVVAHIALAHCSVPIIRNGATSNVRLIFDADSEKLKAVELID